MKLNERKVLASAAISIPLLMAACTLYDNYDIDLMQDATASVETSSSVSTSNSSAREDVTNSSESHGDSQSSSSKKVEPPSISSKTLSFSVDENATAGTKIGTVKVSNAIGSESFSIIDASGLFAVGAKTGAITVKKAGIDYETKSEYSVKVAVANSDGRDTATVSIAVTDVNEKPSVTAAAFTLPENSASGTLVGTVVASDPDTKNLSFGVLSYSLVDSTAGASSLFKIDASGRITVAQGADLDYEKTSLYFVKVVVSDKTNSDTAVVSIQLTDVEEVAPSSSSAAPSSSSKTPESSSSAAPTFACGDSTYTRGGVQYQTVEINGLCWTKKNLEFKPSASDGYLCYGDDESNCEKYGYLYTYATAKSVCDGKWRLPTQAELVALLDYSEDYQEFAGSYLKAAEGWVGDPGNGNDELGFTALPGGMCGESGATQCSGLGSTGFWWTSTESGRTSQYVLKLTGDEDSFYADSKLDKTYYGSVRCVR